jgi:hypothetical protein
VRRRFHGMTSRCGFRSLAAIPPVLMLHRRNVRINALDPAFSVRERLPEFIREQVSITFAADWRHDGHADGYVVEKHEGGYSVDKDHES